MIIGDTTGFYKMDTSGVIMCGPHFVYGPFDSYTLTREQKDTYTYPIDGWYWFDTEEQAYNFFGITWSPEVYTMGLLKPWLNEIDNTEQNA